MTKKKGGLGKGLDALFEDNSGDINSVTLIPISDIEPNKGQPRQNFEDSALADLADSIREHGVLQPIILKPLHNGRYQIVAGERRWRASRMAGLSEMPAIIKELSPSATMEIALIENLQRENLNPLEESLGYASLINEHGYTQETLAQKMGKSRPVVANSLRLLKLPEEVQKLLKDGEISTGHAKALLAFEDEAFIKELAGRIVTNDLTVRDIEKLAKAAKQEKPKKSEPTSSWGESYIKELELSLAEELATKVSIVKKGEKGKITLEFYSKDQLEAIVKILSRDNK